MIIPCIDRCGCRILSVFGKGAGFGQDLPRKLVPSDSRILRERVVVGRGFSHDMKSCKFRAALAAEAGIL